MRFLLLLISALQLLKYANEDFLTGKHILSIQDGLIPPVRNVSIGIIGAGIAGLSTFHRLIAHGFYNVHLFEASHRVGGRIYPLEFEGIFLQQGAEFINGQENPIFVLARRLGLIQGQMDDAAMISREALFVSKSGCVVSREKMEKFDKFIGELELHYANMASVQPNLWNLTIAELFEQDFVAFLVHENSTTGETRSQFESLAQIYKSYYEGEWSAPFERLALENYARWKDGTQSFPYKSYTLTSTGYAPILKELIKGIPADNLHLNCRVVNIDYRGAKILLKMGRHLQESSNEWQTLFDFVIVTIPIGHLKRFGPTLFTPPLPATKKRAIDVIGFGAMQKIFLVYDQPFWPANMSSLVVLSCPRKELENSDHIKETLHTLQPHPWAPNKVLVVWLSGQGPELINKLDDQQLALILTEHLRELLPDREIKHPRKCIRTKWLDDDLFLGSYTYITPEASTQFSPDPFSMLAAPIYDQKGRIRVLFAGEGTHNKMYQTTIGAFLSGQREADRLAGYLSTLGEDAIDIGKSTITNGMRRDNKSKRERFIFVE